MKARIGLVVGFGALVGSIAFAQAPAKKTSEDFVRNWAKSMCLGSVDGITSFYEDSEEVVAIQSTGHVRTGRDEIRREYEAAFREVVFEDVGFANLKVREANGMAWATGRFSALTRRKSDASKWRVEIYTSLVLKRIDESWWIVLEQSTPIDGVPRVRPRK